MLDRHLVRLSREIDRLIAMLAHLPHHQAITRLSAKSEFSVRTQAAPRSHRGQDPQTPTGQRQRKRR
jgi:hypothetical protein